MRVVPSEAPRRSAGLRTWLIVAAALLLLLAMSLRGLARFYTDYLWFQEVGFEDTWRGLLSARLMPAAVFSAFFFALLLANLVIADRLAPRTRTMGPEDEIVERYRTLVAPYSGRLRFGVALFFAIVMGSAVSSEWRSWVLFRNGVDFGVEDPQFHRDIGFYVFQLPFLRYAAGWMFTALLVVLVTTTVFHYVNGGIRLQSPYQRVTPQVKAHLSVILAAMALAKTWQYYLARFELNFSHRGAVDGASYTDVKAQLPALNFLMIISIAAALLFIGNIFIRGWVLPVIAVGLWGFISLVVGTIYPAAIQRFQVQPNEFQRERPYISRNIEATREAFGLDDEHIVVRDFDYETGLDTSDVEANRATLENARLWDPVALRDTYRALQELKTFFTFEDVDIDRYQVGDQVLPVFVAARELNDKQLPSGTWTNTHLVYTHGYGAVMAAANQVEDGDAPSFVLADIPPGGEVSLDQPDLYFGENMRGFAVVDTKVEEYQPSSGSQASDTSETSGGSEQPEDGVADTTTRYAGRGGVDASSFLRRFAFTLRFGSWDLMVSKQLEADSRIIFMRDIRERVEAAAPFLHFDADPYPVVIDERVVWIIDGYTITDHYPYAQSLDPEHLPEGSGLDTSFNYVRNSVKATVDAYDGTIRFYVVDDEDPIIRAYRKAFPEMFSDGSDVPEELRPHFRYPEDLFRAQTEQYGVYHMTDPQVFYNKQDLWDIAPRGSERADEATGGETATTAAGSDGGRNTTLRSTSSPIDPLYLTMQLPEEEGQEFVLLRPYVPRRKDNQLSAFLVARSDGDDYGKLVLYQVPGNTTVPSPAKAASQIEAAPKISEVFTLLGQRGSQVIRGNVQLIPVENSILYVRPIYVEGQSQGTFPRFKYVAVAYGDESVLAPSMEEALADLFAIEQPDGEPPPEEDEEPPPEEEEPPPEEEVPDDVAQLLAAAADELAAAEAALADQDLGAYQEHVKNAQDYVERAAALAAGETAPTTTVPPSASTTTTTTGGEA